jgi:hypothetical protein
MASWHDVEAEAPELAARARELFDANKHKTLATLRRDGSPRISGIEAGFEDGELWFGSMWRAVKALDLQRDPRSPSTAPPTARTSRPTRRWPAGRRKSAPASARTGFAPTSPSSS